MGRRTWLQALGEVTFFIMYPRRYIVQQLKGNMHFYSRYPQSGGTAAATG